jgi:hypothetical protein
MKWKTFKVMNRFSINERIEDGMNDRKFLPLSNRINYPEDKLRKHCRNNQSRFDVKRISDEK